MADFHRHVAVAVAVSVQTVSVPSVNAVAAGASVRQYRGRPRSHGAEFPVQKIGRSSRRVRTAGTEKLNSNLYERMKCNGELKETENVIFLHKLRNSYG